MSAPLVTVAELRDLLASAAPPRLLDVRWRVDRPDGSDDFRAGHLPGAVFVDLDTELSQHGAPADGRHPLPSRARLEESARSWGLDEGQPVVAYDDNGGLSAARAWWLLRWAGVDVRVLDGGITAWREAGGPLESGDPTPRRGTVTLREGLMPVIDIDGAAATPARGVLLDARAPERYRGDVEPIDPVPGHIPGARNAPAAGNLGGDGRFLSAARLRERCAALGGVPGTEVAAYCGSGVTAAADILALEIAGVSAALYPGSWSQWANTPGRPVATGDESAAG
jgi:thiosulfate/3-mercaptopyruvate sulfurtransferase